MSDNRASLGAGALGCNEGEMASMVKRVDDARALFSSFGSDADDFHELNREEQVGKAINRWPLIKAMPIGKRALPAAVSMWQGRAWIEPPVRSDADSGRVAARAIRRNSLVDTGKSGVGQEDALSDVLIRLEGSRRSLFQRLLRRSDSTSH